MILWINGPYGVGKSTLAEQLHQMRLHSFIFDAEEVGNAVRENMPPDMFNGYIFEGYELWFEFCTMLLEKISQGFDGDIYVPMTLVHPDSFEKIAEPLMKNGIEVRHILLESDYKTVHDRIIERGEEEGCWCMENIKLCLENQRNFRNVIRLKSLGATAPELAREVLQRI